ncbi:MAG: hypothetical protein WB992_20330 [Bryobacteraceae bacterium]
MTSSLRNRGFFIGEQGVSLSPAYDINPSSEGTELSLAINEVETICDVSVALEAHADYGLSKAEADEIVETVSAAVASWRSEAALWGIPKTEQEFMAAAFERIA